MRVLGGFLVAAAVALVVGCTGSSGVSPYGPAVVLTGCVQPGSAPDTYRLAVVGSPNGIVGTTGARQNQGETNPTGTAAENNSSDIGAATTRMYDLVASKNVNLAIHQGSVVQIVGHLENQRGQHATGTSGTTAGQAQTATPPETGQQNGQPGTGGMNPATGQGPQSAVHGPARNRPVDVVQVDSIKRVAGTCAGMQ